MELFNEAENGKGFTKAIGPIPAQDHYLCGSVARSVGHAATAMRPTTLA
jgi:hypothetical protein